MSDYEQDYSSDDGCRKEKNRSCFGPYVVVASMDESALTIIREKCVRKLGDQATLSVNTGCGSSNVYTIPLMDKELIAVTDRGNNKVKLYKACNMKYCREVCVDETPFHMWYNQPN